MVVPVPSVVGPAGRKHREKNVSFKETTKTTLSRLETKVRTLAFSLGTVFVLLRTK